MMTFLIILQYPWHFTHEQNINLAGLISPLLQLIYCYSYLAERMKKKPSYSDLFLNQLIPGYIHVVYNLYTNSFQNS
jgi:hypothetical protein